MRLAFKILKHTTSVNSFVEADEYSVVQGNAQTLYFRIVDQDETCESEMPLRHIPSAAATAVVNFIHIDSNLAVNRVAAMAYPDGDRSIWRVEILATDHLQFNGLTVSLTDNSVTTVLELLTELMNEPSGSGKYFC